MIEPLQPIACVLIGTDILYPFWPAYFQQKLDKRFEGLGTTSLKLLFRRFQIHTKPPRTQL